MTSRPDENVKRRPGGGGESGSLAAAGVPPQDTPRRNNHDERQTHNHYGFSYRRSPVERHVSATFARRADAEALAADWPELDDIRVESRLPGDPWKPVQR